MTSGTEDIHKSLEILFTTSLGERIMNPQYGCNLKSMLFEPMDTSAVAFIRNLLTTAILYHEPRIDADNIDVQPGLNEGEVMIQIEYTVRGTNSRFNFVYPFYIKEAGG
ncbi:MAG: hypothetical protein GWM98_24850 [Nitrospinaceae bacterium]|nr:GPW/gp25 family protein [Nitrospinaceae bacterium]NIR57105.1 GPW/gp25 family protein [Nitrospinaceae bacterium]NIS87546.1 GPW/gp25 family protein [Nitrospinaceae bacterium]NIT84416.1 GPW/gp25 family protein [Nitrospinaceae bacterium]NIU46603.1 GPW/gp25 family protein [Nitrospinaceae bacterium]